MRPRDEFKGIRIERGELVQRIKNLQQKDWLKACRRLGLPVSDSSGKGSHAVVYRQGCTPSDIDCCLLTLPRNLHPGIQRDLFKKVLGYGIQTGLYKEDDVWRDLGIKVK